MTSRMRRPLVYIGFVIPLVVLLTACGTAGSAGDNVGGTGFSSEVVAQRVQVAADPSGALRWDRATYEAKAGDITFVVANTSPAAHQFTLEGSGVNYRSGNFKAKTTNTFTVKGLPAGEYRIICDYPGHKAAGMVAKLIVR
jgi:plastocyanin